VRLSELHDLSAQILPEGLIDLGLIDCSREQALDKKQVPEFSFMGLGTF
jgi:hypothetical protein